MVRVLLVSLLLFVSVWGAPCESPTTTAEPCPTTTTAIPCLSPTTTTTEAPCTTTTTTTEAPCPTTTTAAPCPTTTATTEAPCTTTTTTTEAPCTTATVATTTEPCPVTAPPCEVVMTTTTTASPCITTTTTTASPCTTTTAAAGPCPVATTTTVAPCHAPTLFADYGPSTDGRLIIDPTDEPVVVDERCRDGWTRYRESCYFVERETKMTLKEAEAECLNKDAGLFVLNSEDELKAIFKKAAFNTWTWLGLRKGKDEKEPRWQLTDAMDYEKLNWLITPYSHAANGWSSASECAAYWNPSMELGKYTFYYPCDYKFHFVCERNSTLHNPTYYLHKF